MKYRVVEYIVREAEIEADNLDDAYEAATYLSDEDFKQTDFNEEILELETA
jgi:hypothetical protein